MSISRAELRALDSEEAIGAAWPVVAELRPHLDRDALVEAWRMQREEGYRAVGLFLDEICVGFAGYRLQHMLAHGRLLYVDDLVVGAALRDQGAGSLLMEWLVEEARSAGCASLQLDSGVQRHAAHAFYFARGMHIASHHFRLALEG